MPKNIIIGAKTNPEKLHRARELRRTMTPGEKVLWARLRANQLHGYHFRRQHVIAGLIADFYCHAAGLVIEVDGGIHNTRCEEDAVRDVIIQDLGLTVLRIKEEEVLSDIDVVLERIASACEKARI